VAWWPGEVGGVKYPPPPGEPRSRGSRVVGGLVEVDWCWCWFWFWFWGGLRGRVESLDVLESKERPWLGPG
jgi:hypothetical protein